MSDISQVTVGGTTYDIKDATARTDKDKVAQYNANVATDNSYYPIVFSYSTSSSDVTTYLKKTNSIYYNPYAKNLKVSGTNSTTGKSHETSVYYDRLKVYDRYFEDPTDVSTLVEECIEITPTDITVTEGDTWDGTNASLKDSITQLKSNLTDLATIDFGESSSVVSVNGTYQIPAEVLAHTFIIIGARRQGWGNSVMFLTANLLATDNGFFLPTQSNQGYSLKCSSTGLLTLTAKTSGVNEPFIFVQGIF